MNSLQLFPTPSSTVSLSPAMDLYPLCINIYVVVVYPCAVGMERDQISMEEFRVIF